MLVQAVRDLQLEASRRGDDSRAALLTFSQRNPGALTACILDAVNWKCVDEALDILVMRLHALQAAKQKGGSWEKASRLELIPASGVKLLPAGLSGMAA
jgi:hypothetical protein